MGVWEFFSLPYSHTPILSHLFFNFLKFDADALTAVFKDDEQLPETKLDGGFHYGIPGKPPVGLFFHVLFQFVLIVLIDLVFQGRCTPHNRKKNPVSRPDLQHAFNFPEVGRIPKINDGCIPVFFYGSHEVLLLPVQRNRKIKG